MKFGVREICDVVLKAKAPMKVGNKVFYTNEPVIYFDTLKTSSLEGASNTVYAQGGRGNARLMAWDGERTVTFTMEDALISPEGFMILSGAGLIDAKETSIKQHATQIVMTSNDDINADDKTLNIVLNAAPYDETDGNYIYAMLMNKGEIVSEPYIAHISADAEEENTIVISMADAQWDNKADSSYEWEFKDEVEFDSVLVDYYIERTDYAKQINITPDSFGGNFYLEASTLFRDTNGVDMPAEFIIPNCKVQSNFTFTMASSGDPSTFTFTMDAFPDYTRFNKEEKVLASIQIIESNIEEFSGYRSATPHNMGAEE